MWTELREIQISKGGEERLILPPQEGKREAGGHSTAQHRTAQNLTAQTRTDQNRTAVRSVCPCLPSTLLTVATAAAAAAADSVIV